MEWKNFFELVGCNNYAILKIWNRAQKKECEIIGRGNNTDFAGLYINVFEKRNKGII